LAVYLGFGANLGDRYGQIKKSLALVHALPETRITRISSLYETTPVGYTDQGNFLNGACELETLLPPVDLLKSLLAIEDSLGRVRTVRWGPRTIDLDILFYHHLILHQHNLTIPHPAIAERGFVLYPLAEIAPHFIHPEMGYDIAALLAQYRENGGEKEYPVAEVFLQDL
jgi:2-amino-4-hydroxy-6-hydroxymethyldihydropteridine diphosphokinase